MDATTATISVTVSHRDRAVLRAVASGRASVEGGALFIDGRFNADQFALVRLGRAGLVTTDGGPARLTAVGSHVLLAV
ncbi:hypothetical protein [Actinomycetospora cinnamomea]|uniref:Uncharacterized protein n=1 Tax=Actinomycetospora cinnamomea TaxID=663609 RepID=A0A2U1FPR4_9PSEU|nr:hypothetical protein [Actinomycetospora cinnamomea]PVZ14185.1 hypothetical protein C8D89_10149 [Actinomycetospora cinnamomea]